MKEPASFEQKREYLRIFFEQGQEAANEWLKQTTPPTARALTVQEAKHLLECFNNCCGDDQPTIRNSKDYANLLKCMKLISL